MKKTAEILRLVLLTMAISPAWGAETHHFSANHSTTAEVGESITFEFFAGREDNQRSISDHDLELTIASRQESMTHPIQMKKGIATIKLSFAHQGSYVYRLGDKTNFKLFKSGGFKVIPPLEKK